MSLEVRRVGPDAAADVAAVVRRAFSQRPVLDPPADALTDDLAAVRAALVGDRGVALIAEDTIVACTLIDPRDDHVFLRRFAVAPDAQGQGIGTALLAAAEAIVPEVAPGARALHVWARSELSEGIDHWLHQGFEVCARPAPYVELRRVLPTRHRAVNAEEMRSLGRELAGTLVAGDVVVLSGELGAGKTTFTQGLGAGLGVRGDVTSPTFVISRVHPSLTGGPALVHVDAYRLGEQIELDDLDLDAFVESSVTVVEWGRGVAEGLSESRVEVDIVRAVAEAADDEDVRDVVVRRWGPRWETP